MPRRRITLLPLLLALGAAAAANLGAQAAFVMPIRTGSSRMGAPLQASSSPTSTHEEPQQPQVAAAPAPAPLTAEEAAQRRAALKEALLQSLVDASASPSASTRNQQGEDPVLACPVSLQPLRPEVRLAGHFGEIRTLVTPSGEFRYPTTPAFLDLVPSEDRRMELGALVSSIKPMQDLFRSPLTSFLYERGWRVRVIVSMRCVCGNHFC
jgi:hypothetical protein